MGRATARTGNRPVVLIRRIIAQQLRQRGSSGLVHGGSHSGLDRIQIVAAAGAVLLKNHPKEAVYFAGDLLLDRLRRFFSWAVCSVCSTGRVRQILRLTSINSPVKVWNLRNSAISLSALRTAAGEGRFWVTVLPSTFWVIWK